MSKDYGLPIPSLQRVPRVFTQNPDLGIIALTTKLDSITGQQVEEIIRLYDLKSPEQCPVGLLPELGYMLAAGITSADSETVMRRKIAGAVAGHKVRGSWVYDAKPKIDAITLSNAVIYGGLDFDWPFRLSDGTLAGPYPWAERGGLGDGIGIIRAGLGNESIVAGNIYIDVGTSGLTTDQMNAIRVALATDIVPSYMRIFIGYTTAGVFTVYPGGQIG